MVVEELAQKQTHFWFCFIETLSSLVEEEDRDEPLFQRSERREEDCSPTALSVAYWFSSWPGCCCSYGLASWPTSGYGCWIRPDVWAMLFTWSTSEGGTTGRD